MVQDPNIKPFLTKPSGPVFIALNVLRLLSIVALLLVFAANVVTMANDIKAIKADSSSSTSDSLSHTNNSTITEEMLDCDYIEYSTVPDQAAGSFWSILNRLFIIFECILLTLSEIGFPKRLFQEFIPFLGPSHGLGVLGVFEALIGAQVLSHYCELFPQVASWLLFIIGCLNMIAGLAFRSSAKSKRLLFSWENVTSLTPQTRAAASTWDMVTEKIPSHPFRRQEDLDNPVTWPTKSQKAQDTGSGSTEELTNIPLSRPSTNHSDTPLLPTSAPGARFGGFGFGRQGEKAAADRGWKISKPVESLPRYAI